MGRRILKPRNRQGRTEPHAVAPPSLATERILGQARALLECTRAILCAGNESELAGTVCEALAGTGIYAEVCIAFVDAADSVTHRRSFYAGDQTQCIVDPDQFWATPVHHDALGRVLQTGTLDLTGAPAGRVAVPVLVEGRAVAVFVVCTVAERAFDPGEPRQMQLLANDFAFALAQFAKEFEGRAVIAGEKRLRETFEYAGVGITRLDENGCYVEANQKFCDMLGYSREELIGRSARTVTPPEDYGAGVAFREQARLGHATAITGEKRYIRKDGTAIWTRRTMSVAYDDAGRLSDTISVVEDITERKLAEELIRHERALLKTIIDALPDFIYVKDAQDKFQLGNKAWLTARGLLADEVRSKTVFDIFPQSLAQRLHEQDRRVIESGEPVIDQETPIYMLGDHVQQSQRWSLTSKVPMRDDDGNIIGIVGISREITERRRMERERTMEHRVARVLSESRSAAETMPILIRTICDTMGWAYGAHWAWNADLDRLHRAEWWCEFKPEFDPADAHLWTEFVAHGSMGLVRTAWTEQRPTWFADLRQIAGFRRQASCLKLGFRSAFAFSILARDERVGVMEFFGREVREPDDALLEVSGAISGQIGQFILRKRAEESLQDSEQQLRAMFENADVGITLTALDMNYLRVNDKYCEIVGYTREELLRMHIPELTPEESIEPMMAYRERMLNENLPSIRSEQQLKRKDGSLIWVSIATSLVRASDGLPRYFIAVIQDISENKKAAAALQELAHFDILTKLPNRALFYDRLAHGLAQAKRNKWVVAVMFIDVDRFKHVNDTFGHTAGDELLIKISERLADCVRGNDTVGRLSGDEFAVVLGGLGQPEDAALVAKKIVEVLNQPFRLQGAELYVTASVGITLFPADGTDQDMLIRNADVAMYRAKDMGRNNYQFFTPEMNRRTREMLSMESELRRALERDEFVLHYQPKVSLKTGRLTGVEALLRWRHPERGLVPPGDFMPLLEETGLVVRAGDWVLRAVCRQLQVWEAAGLPSVPVAVNLSPRQFLAPNLAQSVRQVLDEHGIPARLVEVELTESSIMANTEDAVRTLEYLQSIGLNIAIDDFGTGYSSLSYLKRFPIRALKIDRSFVRDITTDPDDAAITQAVISMAHNLELTVIAEGVETEAQLAFLAQYGCDEVQGFLFSRPVPGDECAALIRDDRRLTQLVESIKESGA